MKFGISESALEALLTEAGYELTEQVEIADITASLFTHTTEDVILYIISDGNGLQGKVIRINFIESRSAIEIMEEYRTIFEAFNKHGLEVIADSGLFQRTTARLSYANHKYLGEIDIAKYVDSIDEMEGYVSMSITDKETLDRLSEALGELE